MSEKIIDMSEAPEKSESSNYAYTISRACKQLFNFDETESLVTLLAKEYGYPAKGGESSQFANAEIKPQPFNFLEVKKLLLQNEHHSTCIHTKANAHVGLGHLSEKERLYRKQLLQGDPLAAIGLQHAHGSASKVDEVLDQLCSHCWLETITDVSQDYHATGIGHLEVVRESSKKNARILGIHHIPAEDAFYVIEDDKYNAHWLIRNHEEASLDRRFAIFGDLQNFIERVGEGGTLPLMEAQQDIDQSGQAESRTYSEVITFRKPSCLNKWYGYPDWLSAVASIELSRCMKQWKYDFFNNRGVPEFMLFLMGRKLSQDQWSVIENALKANIGLGNTHKSFALNIEEEIKVQLEKLALDNKGEDNFDKMYESLGMAIVTAHRVPPLLAGVLIPGKLGAVNELPNALVAFQALVIGQDQKLFHRILSNTLGNKSQNGGLDLIPEDFEFRKITEAYDMQNLDTMSRMRQTLTEANNEGRSLSDGLKKAILEARKTAVREGQEELVKSLDDYLSNK